MRLKVDLTHLLILAVLFVSFGDRFLPQPMSTVSTRTRDTVTQFIDELLPKLQALNSNAQTQETNQQQEDASNL